MFNYSLLLHQPVLIGLNEPLYHYRLTENSRVRRKEKHLEIGFRQIFDSRLEECHKIGMTSKIEPQIYAAYFSMLKYATLDFYEEVEKEPKKQIICGIRDIIDSIPYIEKSKKSRISKCLPYNIRWFTHMLMSGNAMGVYVYYSLRALVRKVIKG